MNPSSSFARSAPDPQVPIPFDNTYARLPDVFFEHVAPEPVSHPTLIKANETLARLLGIDPEFLRSPPGIAMLSGNALVPGSEPIALAYAGHQFGHFVPQLGDGRAVLLGEVVGTDGRRYDLQLKGSGQTRFSRRGDGRAAIGPVIREYIVSEAMAALGIPTTRSLAAVATGDSVMRERMLPGGVVTRVASSHLRVGTFQYFAARGDEASVRQLADYAIDRHYPHAAEDEQPYRALFDAVMQALARLASRWMLVGFIHGVLNTDNTSIAGETIDYGPCAFMDAYDPRKVFSSIDHHGRYAFENQPAILKWNLARFAETLLPLFAEDQEQAIEIANTSLARFNDHYLAAYQAGLNRKLGLSQVIEGDAELGADLLACMAANSADFTLTFRTLGDAAGDAGRSEGVRRLFRDPSAFDAWAVRWQSRVMAERRSSADIRTGMHAVNPIFIPRNHRIEAAIRDAEVGDYERFHELTEVLARPFDDKPEYAAYSLPPKPEEEVTQTFCGT